MQASALRGVPDLPSLPPAYLKNIEWRLRKDIQEVEKVRFCLICFCLLTVFIQAQRAQSEQHLWMSNNRLLEVGGGPGGPGGQAGLQDWTGLNLNMQPLYSQQQ